MDSEAEIAPNEHVTFTYVNHQGKQSDRRVHPSRMFYGHSQWHHTPQWLLLGYDLDKKANRTFAMNDITGWKGA